MLTPTTRRSLLAVAIPAAALIPAAAAGQDTPAASPQQPPRPPQLERAPARPACDTKRCRTRVARKEVRHHWRAAVRRYGPARLRARMQCESGHDGGYRLDTTGNGFYYAHQFEPRAWAGAGGRMRDGRPVGAWSWHPSRLEQDARAVRWDAIHGGDPWPNCP
jgi:hypothetical protein